MGLALGGIINIMVTLENMDYTLNHAGRSLEILKKINLTIPRGQIAGLVGPSGSGKSSLLALVAGVERPNSGRIEINGVDFKGHCQDQLARFRRDHLGIVFQDFHLVSALTALEMSPYPWNWPECRRPWNGPENYWNWWDFPNAWITVPRNFLAVNSSGWPSPVLLSPARH